MTRQTCASGKLAGLRARGRASVLCAAVLAVCVGLTGCGHEEKDVPKAEVKTIEAYGVTLGPEASPQQVTYVLLKSIADDYAAARAKDPKAQRKAQELTYSLAAPETIEQRLVSTANAINPKLNKKALGADRDSKIFKTVHYWAPIVGHYVPSFANADLQTIERESWVTITLDGETAHVYLPVSHDPAEKDPAKADTATIKVELNREVAQAGGAQYWRVSRLQFLGRQFRAPAGARVVQAYGVTLDENASPAQVATVALRTVADMVVANNEGQKDKRASDVYRLFVLSHPAQVQARQPAKAGEGELDDAGTASLTTAAERWVDVVRPYAQAMAQPGTVSPDKMQATAASGDQATVVYTPAGGQGPVTVQLVKQQADGKSLWRVANIAGAAADTKVQASPTTQPQSAQTQPK